MTNAILVWFMPRIDQDTIEKEDLAFREYLLKNGFDITQMGNEEWQHRRSVSLSEGPAKTE